jgi:phosphatidylcholine synthase
VTGLRRAAAWAVHAYTASGAVLALLALHATMAGDLRAAFLWLAAQVFVDSTDGFLARAAGVSRFATAVDGARMDDIVDYLCYVFVPAVMVLTAGLVPAAAAWPVAALVLLSSAFGFARTDAKTADHFFTGFPSYWNVVAFYLVVLNMPPVLNAALLSALAVLVFVPMRFVYPSRTVTWRPVTLALGSLWAAAGLLLMWQLPRPSPTLAWASLAFPAYYVVLSIALDARRGRE